MEEERQEEIQQKEKKNSFWQSKPWNAFKNFAIIFSFIVNIVLIVVLLLVAPLIIPIVSDVAVPIVSGLNESFVDMGEATIVRTIQVSDTVPVNFKVPYADTTTVVLTERVQLENVNTQFVLPGGGGVINGAVSLSLPEGLELPVYLDIVVPIDKELPVALDVEVEIPLDETELGKPFNDLQAIFAPLDELLRALPTSNEELGTRVKESLSNDEPIPENAVGAK